MQRIKTALRHLVAQQLEARVRKLIAGHQLKVVAVTGSVGKTSTKLAVAKVLEQKFRVQVQEGNFNSEIGLPLAIFGLDVPETLTNPLAWWRVLGRIDAQLEQEFPYDVMVLELGVDEPGQMARYLSYVQPDIGIVTAIAPAHLEQFGSVEAVAREKMQLAAGSRAVLLNEESERVMAAAKGLDKPIQTYGVRTGGVHFEDLKRDAELRLGGRLHLTTDSVKVQTQYVGEHSLAALAAAAAVGEELGLTAAQIKAGVEGSRPFGGRMRVLEGAEKSVIIDDTYNASPASVTAALATLLELPGRHIAILGSMNELGTAAEAAHREVGAAAGKVDLLVTIGELANQYTAAGAAAKGLAAGKIHTFTSPYAAGAFVREQLAAGDVVLAKGSQNGVFAEEAVAQLLAKPADRTKLVRQSPAWQKRKRAQFADAPAGSGA